MKLPAVLFESGRAKGTERRADIRIEELGNRLDTLALPAAYVVKNSDLPCLRERKDLVTDTGRKNSHKGLAHYLLGRESVPLVEGTYNSAGQLARSIRSLLARARERREHKVYLIGTPDAVFAELRKRAMGTDCAESPVVSWWPAGTAPDGTPQGNWRRRLRELLPHEGLEGHVKDALVGTSEEIQLLRLLAVRAARRDVPVLIMGDSGTGKEVVARLIHKLSQRRDERFLTINCGAIPGQLLESELFGHLEGAFTGAIANKTGLWERAGSGTLFLDEIGDLPLHHQAKVLRALAEGKLRPVGANEDRTVNARIVAATNQPLCRMIERGQFRDDLYYRLCALLIRTRPLREHPQDIPVLAQHIWQQMEPGTKPLAENVLSRLQRYTWPGNVRELKFVLRALDALFAPQDILPEHVEVVLQMQGRSDGPTAEASAERELRLHAARCLDHLRRTADALRACELLTRPLTERGKTDEETVQRARTDLGEQLHELGGLCRHPLFFGEPGTFRAVDRCGQELSRFREMLGDDLDDALALWRSSAGPTLEAALQSVFEEVERTTTA